MKTYRKITILFADEEPAAAYSDETIAQTVLERCEEWQQKDMEMFAYCMCDEVTPTEYRDKLQAHADSHPLDPSYASAQYYALKTVFLHE